MKKCILFLFIHFSAMAQPVYCPPEIICDHANQLNPCTFEQHERLYWGKMTGRPNLAGVYHNTYVTAPYYNNDEGYALCVYTHEHAYQTLTLHAKPESNLEMLIQDHEPWRFEESWWECAPDHAQACPLQEQAALMIKNNTSEAIILSNGSTIAPGKFIRLYDIPHGRVDIYNKSNYIGRLVVDLKEHLKITYIIEGDSSDHELIRIEGFNAVEVHAMIRPNMLVGQTPSRLLKGSIQYANDTSRQNP